MTKQPASSKSAWLDWIEHHWHLVSLVAAVVFFAAMLPQRLHANEEKIAKVAVKTDEVSAANTKQDETLASVQATQQSIEKSIDQQQETNRLLIQLIEKKGR